MRRRPGRNLGDVDAKIEQAGRTGGDDDGLLSALHPVDFLFEFGDPLLALGQGTRRIRDPLDLGHQPFNQHIRLKKGH